MSTTKKQKNIILIIANILLVLSLIIFSNLGFLPFKNCFAFFISVIIIFGLVAYRTQIAFLFFVGVIVLENINLAPVELGISIRPYQLLAGIIFVVILMRFIWSKILSLFVSISHVNQKILKQQKENKISEFQSMSCSSDFCNSLKMWSQRILLPKFFLWLDGAILGFILVGFLSAFLSDGANQFDDLEQSVIIASFGILYFITRFFIQSFKNLKKIIPFFLSSSLIIILYGIWQNWQFMHGGNYFEVMPGRPNATFSEPNWLAMFLVFLLAILLVLTFYNLQIIKKTFDKRWKMNNLFYWLFLVLIFVLLILTMSRSAWLGVGVVVGAYLLIMLFLSRKIFKFIDRNNFYKNLDNNYTKKEAIQTKSNNYFLQIFKLINWKDFFVQVSIIFSAIILAIGIIRVFNLSNFELNNRIQSTNSGKQEITISCQLTRSQEFNLQLGAFLNSSDGIKNVNELRQYGCRHINLEEIYAEKTKGSLVTKIYRNDPTTDIRAEVYQKSWQEIEKNLILGIGWGSIGNVLGEDKNGTVLNSSNIFLEIWLGAGISGLIFFMILFGGIFWRGLKLIRQKKDIKKYFFGVFMILGMVAILIPNLFNAGIMLGFLWLFLGTIGITNNLVK